MVSEENDQISAPPLNTSEELETMVATSNSRPMAARAALWFSRLRSAPVLFLQKAPRKGSYEETSLQGRILA